ncbi:hypothetical protein BHM03_00050425, partial [Ensete ventricosum]
YRPVATGPHTGQLSDPYVPGGMGLTIRFRNCICNSLFEPVLYRYLVYAKKYSNTCDIVVVLALNLHLEWAEKYTSGDKKTNQT